MEKRRIYLEKEFKEIIKNRMDELGCVRGLVSDWEDKCATVTSINGTNLFVSQGMEGDCVILLDPAELSVLLPNLHLFQNLRRLVLSKFISRPYLDYLPESLEEITLNQDCGDLSSLCRLPKLRKVALNYKNADLSQLHPIAGQIEELAFSSAKDDSEIASFQNLELLAYGYGTQAGSFAHFSSLTKLRRLFIEHFSYAKLDGLEHCRALETLRIQTADDNTGMYLCDIGALSKLPALRHLALLSDSLRDLSPLANLPLESLKLYYSAVLDFSALSKMKRLKKLELANCLLDDLSVLEPLANLEELVLYSVHTEDYSPLLKLQKLQKAEVDNMSKLPKELCERLGIERPAPKPKVCYKGFESFTH